MRFVGRLMPELGRWLLIVGGGSEVVVAGRWQACGPPRGVALVGGRAMWWINVEEDAIDNVRTRTSLERD